MTPECLELFPTAPVRKPLHYVLAGFCLMGGLTVACQALQNAIPALLLAFPFLTRFA